MFKLYLRNYNDYADYLIIDNNTYTVHNFALNHFTLNLSRLNWEEWVRICPADIRVFFRNMENYLFHLSFDCRPVFPTLPLAILKRKYTVCSLNIVFFSKNSRKFAPSPSPVLGCYCLYKKSPANRSDCTLTLRWERVRSLTAMEAREGLQGMVKNTIFPEHPVY